MDTAITARARRSARWVAAVGAVALLLSGLTAVPAGAQTRDEMRDEANAFVGWCVSMGGVPDTTVGGYPGDNLIAAKCILPDGSVFECVWWESGDGRVCSLHGQYDPTDPGGGLPPPFIPQKTRHGTARAAGDLGSAPAGVGPNPSDAANGGRAATFQGVQVGPAPQADAGKVPATPAVRG